MSQPREYRVVIERGEDWGFVVTVPTLPGCVTHGATIDEALHNAREAIAVYIESLVEDGMPVPASDEFGSEERYEVPVSAAG